MITSNEWFMQIEWLDEQIDILTDQMHSMTPGTSRNVLNQRRQTLIDARANMYIIARQCEAADE